MNELSVTKDFTSEQVLLIKNTVAKGATDSELQMFIHLAAKYNLDPFAKEIWFIKYDNNKPTILTSRDGYLKIAQSNSDFEGLISFVVREGDKFTIDAANYTICHRFGLKRGQISGAWARCDRKGRKPQICYVEASEYQQKTQIWQKYPSAMIQKVAEVFVLRRQFAITGVTTNEELGYDDARLEKVVTIDVEPDIKFQKDNIFKVVGIERRTNQTGQAFVKASLERVSDGTGVIAWAASGETKIAELALGTFIKAALGQKNGAWIVERYHLAEVGEAS